MRILLIDPAGWQKGGINLGLAYLAGALGEVRHQVKILDLNNTGDYLKKTMDNFNPEIIGYSIKTATVKSAGEVSKWVRTVYPGKIQVAGGPHVTLCFREFLLENPQIDFAFLKEGEKSLARFVDNLSKGKDGADEVEGLAFRRENQIVSTAPSLEENLEDLPFPRLEDVININYAAFPYPLLTSRGCPYGCIFCCVGAVSSRRWRARSATGVVEELKRAQKAYGFTRFEILDDNFTLDMARAKEICAALIKEELNFFWYCHNGIRADRLDLELAQLMKRAGCQSCAIGIETSDPDIFRNINKGEGVEEVIKAVELIKKAGMRAVGYFIIGLPGDNLDRVKKTIDFQNALELDDFVYNMLIPYPGTEMWNYVREKGRLLMDIRDLCHFSDKIKVPFETSDFSKEERQKAYELATEQIEFQAGQLKLYLTKRRKIKISQVLMFYFDPKVYRIIKAAYPEAALTVFDRSLPPAPDEFLTKDINFVHGRKRGGDRGAGGKGPVRRYDFALLTPKHLLDMTKVLNLMVKRIDLIIMHRSPHSLKPFRRPVIIPKLSLFLLLSAAAFLWAANWLMLLTMMAYTRTGVLLRNIKSRLP